MQRTGLDARTVVCGVRALHASERGNSIPYGGCLLSCPHGCGQWPASLVSSNPFPFWIQALEADAEIATDAGEAPRCTPFQHGASSPATPPGSVRHAPCEGSPSREIPYPVRRLDFGELDPAPAADSPPTLPIRPIFQRGTFSLSPMKAPRDGPKAEEEASSSTTVPPSCSISNSSEEERIKDALKEWNEPPAEAGNLRE